MGRFADAHLANFSDAELDQFEHLLDALETDLLSWMTGLTEVPPDARHARCSGRVREFHLQERDNNRMAKSRNRQIACRTARAGPAADASPTSRMAPKAWSSPISPRRSPRVPTRRRPARVVICRDGSRMAALARALSFFAPELEVLQFPAWDCLPYDRVSPHAAIVAQRMTALSRLARASRAARSPRCCSPPSTPRCSACRRAIRSPGRRCRPRPATCSAWRA